MQTERYPWLWDVDMDNAAFEAVLHGQAGASAADMDWAILRLVEYAPYREIRRLLPPGAFLRRWPALMSKVRAASRREGMEFFFEWVRRRGLARV